MTIHELEIIKADLHAEHIEESEMFDTLKEKLEAEIKAHFEDLVLEYDDSVVVQYVNINVHYGLYVHVELGFLNHNNKIDFGSEFSICRSSIGVQVNHGSVGPFSTAEAYQVKRLRVLNKIFDDWCRVEEILAPETFTSLIILHKTIEDTRKKLDNIDLAIFDERSADILSQIKVGTEVKYTEESPFKERAFSVMYTNEVTKIANKFIYLTTPYGEENKIDKNTLVKHVINGYLTIK